ncbi:MAG: 30S ribosomal protein S1 [Bdellovibrionales bacterium]|nr:30S ribosomal protein S1 [Bdellovibrionales bacterium]
MITGNTGSDATKGAFADAFEAEISGKLSDLAPGKVVKGTVVDTDREMVTVDIGFKSDGVVPSSQFMDHDGNLKVSIGDEIDVCILALENESGQVVLSHERAQQLRIWNKVEELFANDGTIKGVIVQKVKGGLQVDIGIPAFLPGSQVDIRPHRNLDKFLGEEHEFKVLKITKDKGNIVLSRRAVLMEEREALRSETLKVLAEGVVMEGVVKNVTDYGAFIDLGGIDGLLHITDISWGRVNHPAEKLSVGDAAPVVVLKYDKENERVSLGMKQLKEDPWINVHEKYPVGGKVDGKVLGLTDYGAFVELEEGVEGLVHVSDMSWTKKVRNPNKFLSAGEKVEAVILNVDSEKKELSLGIKQLTPNPWETLHQRNSIGSRVKGQVKSITEFGIFIGVEEGIDGLVHVSDFSWTKKIKSQEEIAKLYKKGDEVEAIIMDIDVENERLSLSIKHLSEDPWETIVQRYPVGSKVKGTINSHADFGVFLQIEEGVDGLIHSSELALDDDKTAQEEYPVGKQIEAEVIKVDREDRRISLSVRSVKDREAQRTRSEFSDDGGSGVTFGDLIQRKMDEQ